MNKTKNMNTAKKKAKNLAKTKQFLRKKFLLIRKKIPASERKKKSKKIMRRILSLHEFRKAKNIMIYHSFREEAETKELIEKAIDSGKEIFVPSIHDEKNCLMHCVKFDKESEIIRDCFGICAPKNKKFILHPKELDMIIVPGIAFDFKGNRIGWGRGYFDRFLKKLSKKCVIIGLAFEKQLSRKEIPHNKNDVKMDFIATEKKIINLKK